jgi:hypothetical protein
MIYEREKEETTEKLKRHDQVPVTRLRTGYSRATHRNKMEGALDPDCLFCSAKLPRIRGRKTKE